jgi:hypothetical protein
MKISKKNFKNEKPTRDEGVETKEERRRENHLG